MESNVTKVTSVLFSLFALIIVYSSFVIVDAGYVGVVKRLGAVQPQHLSEGFHFKVPFIE